MPTIRRALAIAFVLLCISPARAALTADNLLLVVNKNVPDGQKLAEYYAQQRHVPPSRIVSLDLPTGDEISVDEFDEKMVAPIREYLAANHLEQDVTCIVDFYGVPLRIRARPGTPELRAELVSLRKQLAEATKQAQVMMESLEKLAGDMDPAFKAMQAPAGQHLEPVDLLPARGDYTVKAIVSALQRTPAGSTRQGFESRLKALSEQFRAPVNVAEAPTNPATPPTSAPAPAKTFTQQELKDEITRLAIHRGDPVARRAFCDFVRQHGGIILFMQVLNAQDQYLTPDESEAAVDNELAAMGWGWYSRFRWQTNPLNYKYPGRGKTTMMVSRLDGSSPDEVHAIIDTSIKVEGDGLKGKIVLDSRGLPPAAQSGKPDGYGIYDQTIRNLATLIRNHSQRDLLADDKPELLPPGSAKDVAVYCGWYSPAKYVPSVSLAPGAVALHIASFEMVTLHNPTGGWCRNLLDNGAVATLGPVAEPYLHSFPPADEFFGLLLTGKCTLAETYWLTNPLVSWKITLVGDPLYTPFKTNPVLNPEDLPAPMQPIFANR